MHYSFDPMVIRRILNDVKRAGGWTNYEASWNVRGTAGHSVRACVWALETFEASPGAAITVSPDEVSVPLGLTARTARRCLDKLADAGVVARQET